MAKKRWSDLSPRSRRLIMIGGAIEGVLKTAALVDLVHPLKRCVGRSHLWAAAIGLINSVGVVPITYFAYGRRT